MSEKLYAMSTAEKKLVLIEGAGHSNIAWSSSFDKVGQAVNSFFRIPAIEARTH